MKELQSHNTVTIKAKHVAEYLIESLTRGTSPWKPGWENNNLIVLPHNAVTGRTYNGWNLFILWLVQEKMGTNETGWITEHQASKLSVEIRDDADGVVVQYLDAARRFSTAWTVFNMSQTSGFKRPTSNLHKWDPVDRVERLLANSNARVIHDHSCGIPHYVPQMDLIVMPHRERFFDSNSYYRTLLHELGHWTGHHSRLDRDLNSALTNNKGRAREELYAEIASLMLGRELGTGHDLDHHASYVKSWVRILQDDIGEIQQAVGKASKIRRYIKSFDSQPSDRSLPAATRTNHDGEFDDQSSSGRETLEYSNFGARCIRSSRVAA